MRRGQGCLPNGKAYETMVAESLGKLRYKNIPIIVSRSTAGASDVPDIIFAVGRSRIALECKTKGAFEGGGKKFETSEKGLVINENCIHKILIGDYIPWNGCIPSYLKGDKSLETYEKERDQFPDEYIDVPADTVAKYYAKKSIVYIQIEGYGLYHTGSDVLGLNVPEFICSSRIRIRYKCHGKTKRFQMSVQASFNYNKSSLIKSPYDLLTNPPPELR